MIENSRIIRFDLENMTLTFPFTLGNINRDFPYINFYFNCMNLSATDITSTLCKETDLSKVNYQFYRLGIRSGHQIRAIPGLHIWKEA